MKKTDITLDGQKLREELTALHRLHSGNDTALRKAILDLLGETFQAVRDAARDRLLEDGDGPACARTLSDAQDELIRCIHDFAVTHVYRAMNPSDAERLCIVAVGGYGRGMLAPGSDIDLLFLLPYKQTAWGESVVEYLLYALWDMGFKVGHATRSVTECIKLSKTDATIETSILEARYVWGEEALFDELTARFEAEVMAPGARAFIANKLEERDERHTRAGRSRYLVEPDVKDGKGGLRDLHALFWIAKYCYRTKSGADLVKAGLFTRAEYRRFRKCEDFLWSVRCHLHFLTGRAEDRLSFDLQPQMAERLGYAERDGLNYIERFMKHYFLVAKDVGDLTRIFCAALEQQEMKEPPIMSRVLNRLRGRTRKVIREAPDFTLVSGRINISDPDVYDRDPVNLIRLFYLADKHDVLIHPEALKMVTRRLKLIGKSLRQDPEANRLFIEILTSKNKPEDYLRRMNEAGVLGRFIPDFGKIVALMQFNMYHHYTVDEHLLRSIGVLGEIERGEVADEHPLAHEIIHALKHRNVLFVAMLLHDVAKGRKESHSVAGERVARKLCPRLGLSGAETDLVAWLVRHHLVMSDFAQKRDLNDYKTILDFCEIVQSPERLKLLLILTVADIKAVGPGVWNGWKGALLRTLYYEAEPVLMGGHVSVPRAQRLEEAQDRFRTEMADWSESEVDDYLQFHYPPYWLSVDLARQAEHARLIRKAVDSGEKVVTDVSTDDFTEMTELTVYTPDHPHLLTVVTGACSATGANILSAQIFTTSTGWALDTIHLQREFDEKEDELRRAGRIATLIRDSLEGKQRISELVTQKAKPARRAKAFSVEPVVIIDNSQSNLFTVIEVNGLDRPGLLFKLTSTLSHLNLNIGSAHIATFGERVVDVFYVTDLTGQKIVSENRHGTIRKRLLEALEPKTADTPKAAAE